MWKKPNSVNLIKEKSWEEEKNVEDAREEKRHPLTPIHSSEQPKWKIENEGDEERRWVIFFMMEESRTPNFIEG